MGDQVLGVLKPLRFRAALSSSLTTPSSETYGGYSHVPTGFWPYATDDPFTTGNPFATSTLTVDDPSNPFTINEKRPHMSQGEIVGIAIGSVLAVAAVASTTFFLCLRRRRQRRQHQEQDAKLAGEDNNEDGIQAWLQPRGQLSGLRTAEAVGVPKTGSPLSSNVHDNPPAYEEVQHNDSQRENGFAPGAVSDGFHLYTFQPRNDEGPKLNP